MNLMKMVKSLTLQKTDQEYHPLSLYLAKKIVYGLKQGPHMTNAQLVKKLKAIVEVVKEIGGAIGVDSNMVREKLAAYLKEIMVDLSDTKTAHTIEAQRREHGRYLIVILLCAAERGRTGGRLLQERINDNLKGQSTFPAMIAVALATINDYSNMAPTTQTRSGYEGVAFDQ